MPGGGGGGGVTRTQVGYPPASINLQKMNPKWRIAPSNISTLNGVRPVTRT